MTLSNKLLVLSASVLISFSASASPGTKSPGFPSLFHPILDQLEDSGDAPSRSDTLSVLEKTSAVRDQGDRGTCTIFSTTALLENNLIRNQGAPTQIALSEEWLEYLMMRGSTSDGSISSANLLTLVTMGDVAASQFPYIGQNWDSVNTSRLSEERCGQVPKAYLKSCLLGQMDTRLAAISDQELATPGDAFYNPEFKALKDQSVQFQARFMSQASRQFLVRTVSEVKARLRDGQSLALDLDFYDGAWNHESASSMGIRRDLYNYFQGIVSYPEPGSLDRKLSPKEHDGHSVLVVGYDDDVEITAPIPMEDGSIQNFTYKGVYYFKNSWGTDALGRDFTFAGHPFPGFGMITQKYAHEFGGFYKLDLN